MGTKCTSIIITEPAYCLLELICIKYYQPRI